MNLDEKKQAEPFSEHAGTVTCPYLKKGHWGHGGSGTQDYCLGYGARKLRIPTIAERSRFCYTDKYVQCQTYRCVQAEDRRAESPGA